MLIKKNKNNFKISSESFMLVLMLLIVIVAGSDSYAQKKKSNNQNNAQALSTAPCAVMCINNVSTYIYNNGISDKGPDGNAGFIYPKGTGKTVFYSTGLLWGGLVNGVWSVGGTEYKTGLVPGAIKPDGTPEDPEGEGGRIYRVRSDYKNFTDQASMETLFASEMSSEGKTAQQVYAAYDKDWKEWPAQKGAPYIDKDGNGQYNPDIDIPGMSEEPCQTVWFVANDLNATICAQLYGALPMKMEMQATIWAFNTTGALGNTIFRNYKLINKNSIKFDSMYVDLWSDPEIGDGSDDYAGCDTVLQTAYAYNGESNDTQYGNTPPAAGFFLLKSPQIGGTSLGMTAFHMSTYQASNSWLDPVAGSYENGAKKIRNLFEGKMVTGEKYIDPTTLKKTKFPLNGDPTAHTGWVDGIILSRNDRKMGLVSGPFSIEPGTSQEVTYAQTVAGHTPGVGYIASVYILKFYFQSIYVRFNEKPDKIFPPFNLRASCIDNQIGIGWSNNSIYTGGYTIERSVGNNSNFVKIDTTQYTGYYDKNIVNGTTYYYRVYAYNNKTRSDYSKEVMVKGVVVGIEEEKKTTPKNFVLSQNYPNPFNPSTKIEYSIPKESRVKIEVYNSIGQMIETLTDEVKPAGQYKINFNGKLFTSGVYFFRITAAPLDGGSVFNSTRRMILLK